MLIYFTYKKSGLFVSHEDGVVLAKSPIDTKLSQVGSFPAIISSPLPFTSIPPPFQH